MDQLPKFVVPGQEEIYSIFKQTSAKDNEGIEDTFLEIGTRLFRQQILCKVRNSSFMSFVLQAKGIIRKTLKLRSATVKKNTEAG